MTAPTPTPAPGLDLDAVERDVAHLDGPHSLFDDRTLGRVIAVCNAAPALIAEVRALRAAAEEREADMHARIRAGYDKTVADAWRAEVAKRDAEIARLTAERDQAVAHRAATNEEIKRLHAVIKSKGFSVEDSIALHETRSEVSRLTAELAAARAVPADVEAAIEELRRAEEVDVRAMTGQSLAARVLAEATLRTAIARAISDATAARGTVGGLLATAVVGNRIPQANWRQDPVSLTHRLIIGDFVLYVGKDWIVRRATDRGPAIVTPGSMPEPLAHGPETGAAGMIAAEDAAAELMSRGPLPKGG